MSWNFVPLPILTPERLEQLLETLDITNVEAARLAGVSEATLYRWLSGRSPVPASVIRMLDFMLHAKHGAEMLGVSWSAPEETVDAG